MSHHPDTWQLLGPKYSELALMKRYTFDPAQYRVLSITSRIFRITFKMRPEATSGFQIYLSRTAFVLHIGQSSQRLCRT